MNDSAEVSILNYGRGNIRSLVNAFRRIGSTVNVIETTEEVKSAKSIIFPGVGAYGAAMKELEAKGLDEELRAFVSTGKLLMGICLGMQLLFESSEEFGHHKGLGLVKGKVSPIPHIATTKIPHVNWEALGEINTSSRLLKNLRGDEQFYFVHSYHCEPADLKHVTSRVSINSWDFCSTVECGNVFGCQFHPEKSSQHGLGLLKNFVSLVREADV